MTESRNRWSESTSLKRVGQLNVYYRPYVVGEAVFDGLNEVAEKLLVVVRDQNKVRG